MPLLRRLIPMLMAITALPVLSLALSAAVAFAAEMSREELREMEDLLARLGFPPGAVDGTVDDKTRDAITGYQAFAALPGYPEPSRALLHELRGVVGQVEALRLARDEETAVDLGDFGATEAVPEPLAEKHPAAEEKTEIEKPEPAAQAAAAEIPPAESPPAESPPEETAVEEPAPEAAALPEALPDQGATAELEADPPVESASPDLALPEPVLDEPAPVAPKPAETALTEEVPEEAVPEEAAAEALTVEDPPSEESTPEEPTPEETAAEVPVPEESAPEEPGPEELAAETPAEAQSAVLPAPEPAPAPGPSAAAVERARIAKALAPYQAELSSGELSYGDLARNFNDQGRGNFNRGRYGQALGDFDTAIFLQPNFAAAYHNRAKVYQAMGNAAKAQQDFDKAFDLGFTRLNLQ